MKKRIAIFMLCIILGCGFMGNNYCIVSYAADVGNGASILTTDTIEYKYRVHNGKVQYRRWNATKGKWVDPYWITVSP